MINKVAAMATLALVMVAAYSPAFALEKGKRAPDFKMKLHGDGEVTLDSFKGKILMLNFWATWCGPCRKEMPDLEKAYTENTDRDFVVLGVNYMQNEKKIAKFLKKIPLSFPQAIDSDGDVAKAFGVMALPKSILIDPNGNVAFTHTGPLGKETIKEWCDTLLPEQMSKKMTN